VYQELQTESEPPVKPDGAVNVIFVSSLLFADRLHPGGNVQVYDVALEANKPTFDTPVLGRVPGMKYNYTEVFT
jgi:hypothetical protein